MPRGGVCFDRPIKSKMADIALLSSISPTTGDCKKLIPALKSMFENMQANFEEMLNGFKNEFIAEIRKRDDEISELRSEVTSLKTTVNKLEAQIDDGDAYERRDTVIFSGPAIPVHTPGENCINIVQTIAKNNLKIEIPTNEFNTAHRLGKKPTTQGEDKRSIIVKLCRRDTKKDVIVASRRQGTSPPSLYVNESLTPRRRTLLMALRKMKRMHPNLVTGCTSIDGKIYAFTKNPTGDRDTKHFVNTHERLTKFCLEFVKKPLDTFLDQWEF